MRLKAAAQHFACQLTRASSLISLAKQHKRGPWLGAIRKEDEDGNWPVGVSGCCTETLNNLDDKCSFNCEI